MSVISKIPGGASPRKVRPSVLVQAMKMSGTRPEKIDTPATIIMSNISKSCRGTPSFVVIEVTVAISGYGPWNQAPSVREAGTTPKGLCGTLRQVTNRLGVALTITVLSLAMMVHNQGPMILIASQMALIRPALLIAVVRRMGVSMWVVVSIRVSFLRVCPMALSIIARWSVVLVSVRIAMSIVCRHPDRRSMFRKPILNLLIIASFFLNPGFIESQAQEATVPSAYLPSGAKLNSALTTAMKNQSYFLKRGGPSLPTAQQAKPILFVYTTSQSYDAVKSFFTKKGLPLQEAVGLPKANDYKRLTGKVSDDWSILLENKRTDTKTKKWVVITTITYIKVP